MLQTLLRTLRPGRNLPQEQVRGQGRGQSLSPSPSHPALSPLGPGLCCGADPPPQLQHASSLWKEIQTQQVRPGLRCCHLPSGSHYPLLRLHVSPSCSARAGWAGQDRGEELGFPPRGKGDVVLWVLQPQWEPFHSMSFPRGSCMLVVLVRHRSTPGQLGWELVCDLWVENAWITFSFGAGRGGLVGWGRTRVIFSFVIDL